MMIKNFLSVCPMYLTRDYCRHHLWLLCVLNLFENLSDRIYFIFERPLLPWVSVIFLHKTVECAYCTSADYNAAIFFVSGLLEHTFKISNNYLVKNWILHFDQDLSTDYVPWATWIFSKMSLKLHSTLSFVFTQIPLVFGPYLLAN